MSDVKFTGFYDEIEQPIYVNDRLQNEHGYEVYVREGAETFYGELICDDSHSCKNLPYALNEGHGYLKINFIRESGIMTNETLLEQ